MANVWVRMNGQADLRANIRSALRDAKLSQRKAAEDAGIKYNGLVAALNSVGWLTRDDATALAGILDLTVDELVGASIFKDQRDRYAEFDHMPPESERRKRWLESKAAEEAKRAAELSKGRTRALCCQCGALRTCNARRHRWEPTVGGTYQPRDGHRVTEDLKCFECQEITTHAVLLAHDHRNDVEVADRAPSRHALAIRDLEGQVKRLAEFNVSVTYRPGYAKRKDDMDLFYSSGYEYNNNAAQWEISLDENMAPRLQVLMLQEYWRRISNDDHGVDWDPRGGVWTTPGADAWELVADELLDDVRRQLHVERSRMVLDLQDSTGRDDSSAQS